MGAKSLIDLRKQAEQVVAGMPDGELKVKAFEVVFAHLLRISEASPVRPAAEEKITKPIGNRRRDDKSSLKSLRARLLLLKDEGFFKNQRAISEVRGELGSHGWHYPLTTLSGALQALVQPPNRLRRVKTKQGNRKIWKYSNP